MAETVGDILLRPVKDYFTAVHVEGQFYGEIEPHFCQQYRRELGKYWRLYDKDGLHLRVEYNIEDKVPKITDGWMTLREHYRFKGHHEIFFKYLGSNQFQIIPNMDRIDPSKFPTWHTKSRCLRKAVSFNLTITEDPKVNPCLALPEDMGEYLWNTMLDQVFIIGTNYEKQLCDLTYQKDPFMVTISKGWSECVGIHGFEVGDRLQFNMRNIYDGYLIWVKKLT